MERNGQLRIVEKIKERRAAAVDSGAEALTGQPTRLPLKYGPAASKSAPKRSISSKER
jgi:hypothetical protein